MILEKLREIRKNSFLEVLSGITEIIEDSFLEFLESTQMNENTEKAHLGELRQTSVNIDINQFTQLTNHEEWVKEQYPTLSQNENGSKAIFSERFEKLDADTQKDIKEAYVREKKEGERSLIRARQNLKIFMALETYEKKAILKGTYGVRLAE
ncbi:MAG: hypothetical protein FWF59_03255 [Turicibacter sp.]|nr:hypothetical protein [Turicibacter sp.]